MSTILFPDREIVASQASEWVAMIDRGLTGKQERDLNEWLAASPAHGEALVQFASMWDLMDVLQPIAKIMPIDSDSKQGGTLLTAARLDSDPDAAVIESRISMHPFALAASLAALAVTVVFVANLFAVKQIRETPAVVNRSSLDIPAIEPQVYVTAVGERSNITLNDGSEIKLNTDTKITVQFSEAERYLVLSKGEAYFEVAKNPIRPFVVVTDNSKVTAIGTAFSIDVSDGEDTEVLVTEGTVKISRILSSESIRTEASGTKNIESPVYLSRGQKILLNHRAAEVSYSVDTDTALAWRDGIIIFTGQSLREAISEIDRYIALDFIISDEEIASIPVGGFFKTGDLDQLLLVLEQNFGVSSLRKGDQILLSKAKL